MKKILSILILFIFTLSVIKPMKTPAAVDISVKKVGLTYDYYDGGDQTKFVLDTLGYMWVVGDNGAPYKYKNVSNISNFNYASTGGIIAVKNDKTLCFIRNLYSDYPIVTNVNNITNVRDAITFKNYIVAIRTDNTLCYSKYDENSDTYSSQINIEGIEDVKSIYIQSDKLYVLTNTGMVYDLSFESNTSNEYTVKLNDKFNDVKKIVVDNDTTFVVYNSGLVDKGSIDYSTSTIKLELVKLPFMVEDLNASYGAVIYKTVSNEFYGSGDASKGEFININLKNFNLLKMEKVTGFKEVYPGCGIDKNGKLYTWNHSSSISSKLYAAKPDRVGKLKEFYDTNTSGYQGALLYGGFAVTEMNEVLVYGQAYNLSSDSDIINLTKEYGYNSYSKLTQVWYSSSFSRSIEYFVTDIDGRVWSASQSFRWIFKPKYIPNINNPKKIDSIGQDFIALNGDGAIYKFNIWNNTSVKIDDNILEFDCYDGGIWAVKKDGHIAKYIRDNVSNEFLLANDENVSASKMLNIPSNSWDNNYYFKKSDGTLLGVGDSINSKDKVVPVEGIKDVKELEYMDGSVYTLTEEGEVYVWGSNRGGCLGLVNSNERIDKPTKVTGLPKIKSILKESGPYLNVICVLDEDNYMWLFPRNFKNALPQKLTELGKIRESKRGSVITEGGRLLKYSIDNYNVSQKEKFDISIENCNIQNIKSYESGIVKTFDGESYVLKGGREAASYLLSSEIVPLMSSYNFDETARVLGDVDENGVVDILDISMVSNQYNNETYGISIWKKYDLNKDSIIDLYDLTFVSRRISNK